MSEEGKSATHGYCRKCAEVQPLIWRHFKEVTMVETVLTFEGMEANCEVCDFSIAKLGQAHRAAAAITSHRRHTKIRATHEPS